MAKLTGRDANLFLAGFGFGLAVGGGVGYFSVKKHMQLKYEAIADEEIKNFRNHYHAKMTVLEPKEDLETLVEDLGYGQEFINNGPDGFPPSEEMVDLHNEVTQGIDERIQNVFDEPQVESNWNYEAELASRTPDRPYIIHLDEFTEEGNNNEHVCYTYYSVDDTLVDENEEPIVGAALINTLVGLHNLKQLGTGKGTDDPNTLLIRNEKLSMDIEVANHPYSYEQEHMGELEHADDFARRHRRPKFDDE